jgi:hypothetical protein
LRSSSVEMLAILGETSDGPAKRWPSAVIPWHLAQLFWKTGFAVRFVSEDGVWPKTARAVKNKQHAAIGNSYLLTWDLIKIDLRRSFDALRPEDGGSRNSGDVDGQGLRASVFTGA